MGCCFPGVPLLGGAPFTVGASAPIFGLLGALVCYGRRTGSSHIGVARPGSTRSSCSSSVCS